ncbi:MAG: glycosyltransferase [Gammaproteobacteria bacterium]|nr:glycosyltransferase [Gammaproteobacteria bacterium]
MNDRKERTLVVTRSLQIGGAERHAISLANGFAEIGCDSYLVVLKKRKGLRPLPEVKVIDFNVDWLNRLTGIGLLYDLISRATLAWMVPKSGFVWRGLYSSLYLRLLLKRIERQSGPVDRVFFVGQGAFENFWRWQDPRGRLLLVSPIQAGKPGLLQRFYTRLLYANRHLIVNSLGVKRSLEGWLQQCAVNSGQLELVYNPIDIGEISRLAMEAIEPPAAEYLVHVARLTYQKNQTLLLRAYALSGVTTPLVIVGDGQELPQLQRLATELDIAQRVHFIGNRSNPYPWMKQARLFILSSLQEGFGLVIAESLCCGTPVVATDSPGGVREVLIEEQQQFIAAMTPQSLAEAIVRALASPLEIKPHWFQRFDHRKIASTLLTGVEVRHDA